MKHWTNLFDEAIEWLYVTTVSAIGWVFAATFLLVLVLSIRGSIRKARRVRSGPSGTQLDLEPGETALEFACPQCRKRICFPSSQAGRVQDCPLCAAIIDVPG